MSAVCVFFISCSFLMVWCCSRLWIHARRWSRDSPRWQLWYGLFWKCNVCSQILYLIIYLQTHTVKLVVVPTHFPSTHLYQLLRCLSQSHRQPTYLAIGLTLVVSRNRRMEDSSSIWIHGLWTTLPRLAWISVPLSDIQLQESRWTQILSRNM